MLIVNTSQLCVPSANLSDYKVGLCCGNGIMALLYRGGSRWNIIRQPVLWIKILEIVGIHMFTSDV